MSNLRKETLNRLDKCDCHSPAPPKPSNVMPISLFEEMIYKVVQVAGYTEGKKEFLKDLVSALNGAKQIKEIIVQKSSVEEFPDIGLENAVYIDTAKNHIYYWKDNEYYRIETNSEEDGEIVIPSDGLIYEGGII